MSREGLSRRRFIAVAGATGGAAVASQWPFARARTAPPRFVGYPFTLGVASGDPTPDGVVLWTRLAPAPLSPDGGMPAKPYPVQWEVAKDEAFTNVVARGEEIAVPGEAHSVHAEPAGLEPGYEYFYRFKANGEISPTGRTKTAPATAASVAGLAFAFASCQQYEHGYYTAYKHMANEDLDLVIHLGDYIYEYDTNSYQVSGNTNVRGNSNHEIVDLGHYRERHAQYKSDPDLQAAHAAFPWLVTWDDHEVDNNWADDIPEDGLPLEHFARRRRNAFRAYWEHMPLRKATRPVGKDMQLFRRAAYGNLASFHVLDTRQFRSDQACGDGTRAGCDDRNNPARTLTGAQQEQWLYNGLETSPAKWQVIAQQVFMAQRDATNGPGESYSMDGWDGYTVSRDKLLDFIETREIDNPIVITGDVHQNWANDLLADFSNPQSKILGSEFVGTSISTTGDGNDNVNTATMAENPWIKYNNQRRGYVRVQLDQNVCRTDYRTLQYVKRPGSPITTHKSFVVEAGNPGLKDA
ncbi:alkaline phosphatase D family protein [Solirubrobacter sp. CPCC 204708]|uniref:Alkaline phosphatase D family protein n=1 Tax=Solirubrobacter deserti TaxID=2282478 RepID=A0ABT4RK49_9ACTN|nr:alkaline phosphatase D family protein [Solirubrobacter deserti]MBE2316853.1 alkaline phosphatase D family protein [Solirubrobacter deserti]MDA0138930.1 alkaline phosphatase D family protein [Solirubrobacter deserti]